MGNKIQACSLHIGVNKVRDRDLFLTTCERDARAMQKILKALGFATQILKTPAATLARVRQKIKRLAAKLKAGDIFVLTFSGHGGQVRDLDGDEWDSIDETWMLYNGDLTDDELHRLFGTFRPGVRIVLISDSCFSEGMNDRLRSILRKTVRKQHDLDATVLLIAACREKKTAIGGSKFSLFTDRLLRTWQKGKFKYGYRRFYQQIKRRMPKHDPPGYRVTGAPNPAFERQQPFTIAPPRGHAPRGSDPGFHPPSK